MTTHDEILARLAARWPENRVAPSLARIRALCDLLGDPQDAVPAIQIAGTNGKGSTAIVADALLRATGLRVGRYSSPHLSHVNERIVIDGRPLSDDRFDEIYLDLEPYVAMVDERALEGVAMTFFEVMTAMAFAAFADAPVDVAVIEVGLGGTWDATNVVDAAVAVIAPIDLDHTHLLGDTVEKIAAEKAGIIKPGAHAVLAGQTPEVAKILLARCLDVGALPLAEGVDFGLLDRTPAVGGQVIRLNTVDGPLGDLHLPVYGVHFARNAGLALAAVEAFLGLKGLSPEVIQEGFDDVRLPGRLETVRTSPTVVVDGAHNPHGAEATRDAVEEAFSFNPLIGVFTAMADKDAEAMLRLWEPAMNQIVVTQVASTARGARAADLGELAAGIFGADRVHVEPRMDAALERAVALADADGSTVPGVLVTGSIIGVGEARALLVRDADPALVNDGRPVPEADDDAADADLPGLEIGSDRFGAGPDDDPSGEWR